MIEDEILSLRQQLREERAMKTMAYSREIEGLVAHKHKLEAEVERLQAALRSAPKPSSEHAWVLKYVEWWEKIRFSALEQEP